MVCFRYILVIVNILHEGDNIIIIIIIIIILIIIIIITFVHGVTVA
jgi:hypothetical protein